MKSTEFITNPDKDETVIAHTERFDGLLDLNHEMRQTGDYEKGDMKLVANIPGIILEQYCFQHGVKWDELFAEPTHIKRILNDPANSYFRIAPGKV